MAACSRPAPLTRVQALPNALPCSPPASLAHPERPPHVHAPTERAFGASTSVTLTRLSGSGATGSSMGSTAPVVVSSTVGWHARGGREGRDAVVEEIVRRGRRRGGGRRRGPWGQCRGGGGAAPSLFPLCRSPLHACLTALPLAPALWARLTRHALWLWQVHVAVAHNPGAQLGARRADALALAAHARGHEHLAHGPGGEHGRGGDGRGHARAWVGKGASLPWSAGGTGRCLHRRCRQAGTARAGQCVQ